MSLCKHMQQLAPRNFLFLLQSVKTTQILEVCYIPKLFNKASQTYLGCYYTAIALALKLKSLLSFFNQDNLKIISSSYVTSSVTLIPFLKYTKNTRTLQN